MSSHCTWGSTLVDGTALLAWQQIEPGRPVTDCVGEAKTGDAAIVEGRM